MAGTRPAYADFKEHRLSLRSISQIRRWNCWRLGVNCLLLRQREMIAQLVVKKDVLMHITASAQAPEDILQGGYRFLIERRARVFME